MFQTSSMDSDEHFGSGIGASFGSHQSPLPLFALPRWHRCFLRVSPKPSSCVCILPFGDPALIRNHGASSFVCVLSRFLVVFVWLVSLLVLVAFCTFLHNLLMLNIFLVVADTASLTPLFSWLKGAPPGINPSSYQQKKNLWLLPTLLWCGGWEGVGSLSTGSPSGGGSGTTIEVPSICLWLCFGWLWVPVLSSVAAKRWRSYVLLDTMKFCGYDCEL